MPRRSKKPAGFAEDQAEWEAPLPERLHVKVGPGGRIVIPAVYRKALKAKVGDRLMARVVDGELCLMTPEMGIKRAQRIVREAIPPDVDLVADLFEMRRQEVADEFGDG